MKYQDKSFTIGYGSKNYRENYDMAFGKDDMVVDENGKVLVEFDLDEDMIVEIERRAKENNVSFDEQFEVMLRSGLEIMEQEELAPEHLNAEVHNKLMDNLDNMSDEEIFQTSVDVGIHNSDGSLTEKYK